MGVPLTHRSSNFPLRDQTCRRHSPSSNQSSIPVWNPLLLKGLLSGFYSIPKIFSLFQSDCSLWMYQFCCQLMTLWMKSMGTKKTAWYMTKFWFLKHHGCNLIGYRLSCKNSRHRSLDTRRQCDLPSKSMYHCRLLQTLKRKSDVLCLMRQYTRCLKNHFA